MWHILWGILCRMGLHCDHYTNEHKEEVVYHGRFPVRRVSAISRECCHCGNESWVSDDWASYGGT